MTTTHDTSTPDGARAARLRLEALIARGATVSLTEKKGQRTLSQNAYLWLLLAWWGVQTGHTKDEAAAVYKAVNDETFRRTTTVAGREMDYMRSTADLDTAEMAATIDRFRNWAAAETAVYLPAPGEREQLEWLRAELQRAYPYYY